MFIGFLVVLALGIGIGFYICHSQYEKREQNLQTMQEEEEELRRIKDSLTRRINGYGMEYILPETQLIDEYSTLFLSGGLAKKYKEIEKNLRKSLKTGDAIHITQEIPKEQGHLKKRLDGYRRLFADCLATKGMILMSKAKTDNYHQLKQEFVDCANAISYQIKQTKLSLRIDYQYCENWLSLIEMACAIEVIKAEEKERQREEKERKKEELVAQREYERAIRQAESAVRKEQEKERLLQQKISRMQELLSQVIGNERAKYEQQIQLIQAELNHTQQALSQAEALGQRAKSMAQQTRSGYVYMISNLGSFGGNMMKIGMTRRLDPMERVKELGDASVPFSFDVHAMIYTDDAPALEKQLHKHFYHQRVNKINDRKEFFAITPEEAQTALLELGIDAPFKVKAPALQYYESQKIN